MKSQSWFTSYDLKKIYHELGEFTFKLILDPDKFSISKILYASCRDSAGNEIDLDFKKWGRKVLCRFKIDENTPDGLMFFDIILEDKNKEEEKKQINWWVIKP